MSAIVTWANPSPASADTTRGATLEPLAADKLVPAAIAPAVMAATTQKRTANFNTTTKFMLADRLVLNTDNSPYGY